MRIQNYNELGFTNDFMFAKVMRNRRLCKKLLEVILDLEAACNALGSSIQQYEEAKKLLK